MRRILLGVCLIIQGVIAAVADAEEPPAATFPAEPDPKLAEAIRQAVGQIKRVEVGHIDFMGSGLLQVRVGRSNLVARPMRCQHAGDR